MAGTCLSHILYVGTLMLQHYIDVAEKVSYIMNNVATAVLNKQIIQVIDAMVLTFIYKITKKSSVSNYP